MAAGSGGGGTAGKSKNSTQLSFQRHVPRFLQPYAHMLGQKKQDEDEPQTLMLQKQRAEQEDEEEEDQVAEQAGAPTIAFGCDKLSCVPALHSMLLSTPTNREMLIVASKKISAEVQPSWEPPRDHQQYCIGT